ncbi:uncharacterized protein LOC100840103 [Brachypodium distachyon]|uniref:Uncharacterized protein n=1 Tax=Brachypodium distachyon TaxID=15368 RepID=I1HD08_BRADI|nr:uncharacterized protein LOC100840103 [Brachypodium distachyon]KQK03187.1 hypothetical protein BRADI_2g06150v3 [Brachypodium distachyon]|eukprot:XP_003565465.1 uncharacterized protein LOC100840103 [Brachypodium distachyon]
MAPNGDAAVAARPQQTQKPAPRRNISMGGLQRAMSDLALEFMISNDIITTTGNSKKQLPAVSEQQEQEAAVGEARCECCGMTEECTAEYAARVRDRHCGRLVCGLCAAAVSASGGRTETTMEEALAKHMGVCGRFNRVGRANPVLMQSEAMREMLKKSRGKSTSPRAGAGRLARSSSCISAITKDLNLRQMNN